MGILEKENGGWKDVPNYEGLYSINTKGDIKSLSRIVLIKGCFPIISKERILKAAITSGGYLNVRLYKNGKAETFPIHQLVAFTFLNHSKCGNKLVINHINHIKTDNRVENLEIVTQRENSNKKHLNSSSKYVGVTWCKTKNKWISRITIGAKTLHLGCFMTEIEAHNAYKNKLKQIQYEKNN